MSWGDQALRPQGGLAERVAAQLASFNNAMNSVEGLHDGLAQFTELIMAMSADMQLDTQQVPGLLQSLVEPVAATEAAFNNLNATGNLEHMATLMPATLIYVRQLISWMEQLTLDDHIALAACRPSTQLTSSMINVAKASLFNVQLVETLGVDQFKVHAEDMRSTVVSVCHVASNLLHLLWPADDVSCAAGRPGVRHECDQLGRVLLQGILALGDAALSANDNMSLPQAVRSPRNVSVAWKTFIDCVCKTLPPPAVSHLITDAQVQYALHVCLDRLAAELRSFTVSPRKDRLQVLAFWQGHVSRLVERFPACASWDKLVQVCLLVHTCLCQGPSSTPIPTSNISSHGSSGSDGPGGDQEAAAAQRGGDAAVLASVAEKMEPKMSKVLLSALEYASGGGDAHASGDMQVGDASCDLQSRLQVVLPAFPHVTPAHLSLTLSLLTHSACLQAALSPATLLDVVKHLVPELLGCVSIQQHLQAHECQNVIFDLEQPLYPVPCGAINSITLERVTTTCISLLLAISRAAAPANPSHPPGDSLADSTDAALWQGVLLEAVSQLITCGASSNPVLSHIGLHCLSPVVQAARETVQVQLLAVLGHVLSDAAVQHAGTCCGEPDKHQAAPHHLESLATLMSALCKAVPQCVVQAVCQELQVEVVEAGSLDLAAAASKAWLWRACGAHCPWGSATRDVCDRQLRFLLSQLQQVLVVMQSGDQTWQEAAPHAVTYMHVKVSWMLECMCAVLDCALHQGPLSDNSLAACLAALEQAVANSGNSHHQPCPPAWLASALKLGGLMSSHGCLPAVSVLLPVLPAALQLPTCTPLCIPLIQHALALDPPPSTLFQQMLGCSLDAHWLLRHEALSAFSAVARNPGLRRLVPMVMLPCMAQPPAGAPASDLVETLLTYTHGRLHDGIISRQTWRNAAVREEANVLQTLDDVQGSGPGATNGGSTAALAKAEAALLRWISCDAGNAPVWGPGADGGSQRLSTLVQCTLEQQSTALSALHQLGACTKELASQARLQWRHQSQADQQAVKEGVEGLLMQLGSLGGLTGQMMQELRGLVSSLASN